MVRTKRFELSCIAHRFLRPAVSTNSTTLALNCLEEAVGFEPTDRFQPADFKSAAIDHSATLPMVREVGLEPTTSCIQSRPSTN